MSGLYQTITQYGDFIRLGFNFDSKTYIKWTEENFDYVKYNPRKPIARYGLSLTSLDGGLSGIPDLDSLHEYNQENKTNYEEKDFNVYTDAYIKNENIKKFLYPFEGNFLLHQSLNHIFFDALFPHNIDNPKALSWCYSSLLMQFFASP